MLNNERLFLAYWYSAYLVPGALQVCLSGVTGVPAEQEGNHWQYEKKKKALSVLRLTCPQLTHTWVFFLTPPSEKCHMTCQIGSEEPPSSNGSIDQTRKKGRNREVLLDVSPQIPFPCRAHWSKKLSAVMYLKVVFFAVVVAAVGAAAAPDSGKFATSRLLS